MAVHLINPMWDAYGGSEWRTLSLFSLLAEETDVRIWTEYTPDRTLSGRYPISEMLQLRSFPKGGTLVIVGCYFEIGRWIAAANPDRVILVYNIPAPHQLEARLRELASAGIRDVELVYSSQLLASSTNLHGRVEHSPIDLTRFSAGSYGQEFTVGRHSRDVEDKFAPDELDLIATTPYSFRYLGATVLRRQGEVPSNLTVVPNGAMPAEEFLRSISCFFYRTHPNWNESYGRVVVEAMASGLPCVLEARHGYAELVEDGRTALLFETKVEAQEALARLALDPSLRKEIGEAARESIQNRYAAERAELLEFYLSNKHG